VIIAKYTDLAYSLRFTKILVKFKRYFVSGSKGSRFKEFSL